MTVGGVGVRRLHSITEAMRQRVERPPRETSRDLLRQQRTLLAFIESIGSELELRPLLTRIVRHACELIGADQGSIGLVDGERGLVRTEAIYRMPPDELGAEAEPGAGLAGRVLEERGPVVLDRYGDLPHPIRGAMLEDAVLGLPILAGGRPIGFFGIGIAADPESGRPRRTFEARDVELLTLFARHAANAIENARNYRRERRRTERLELIARVGRIMAAHLDLEELLQSAADAIHEVLRYPNVAIGLVEPETPDTLVTRAISGDWEETARSELGLPDDPLVIPFGIGIMGAAARSRSVEIVNDVSADPRYIPGPGGQEIRADLAIPIERGERLLGILNIESVDPFVDEDARILKSIASQLAMAIDNARLYEGARRLAVLEERQRLARELHDSVTQTLFGIALMSESLETAWRRNPREGERRVARVLELSRSAHAEMRASGGRCWRPDGPRRPSGPTARTCSGSPTTAGRSTAWRRASRPRGKRTRLPRSGPASRTPGATRKSN